METSDKSKLTKIGTDSVFRLIMEKFCVGEELLDKEKNYILASAILFLKAYEEDLRRTSYADFAYYIILKYSLSSGDYKPLYDFSVNFGFYPISVAILKEGLMEEGIEDIFVKSQLYSFKNDKGYIQTLEQSKQSKYFLESNEGKKAYIAPTSFGKSSIIIDYIKKFGNERLKIGIIVPSKSLLAQTYNDVRKANLERKILIHNEMYNNEDSFIAVFTQERALRLLNKNQISFDILIIEEAHNLLKGKDGRSLLLARLIRQNQKINPSQRVIYLSPLIKSAESLQLSGDETISNYLINFNIKEAELFEYTTNGDIFLYNRFIKQFYKIGEAENKLEYIKERSGKKNFIYETSPKKIEQFAIEMASALPRAKISEKIQELKEILRREIHEDFYMIESLNAGIVYIHGRLPELIKEYLEYKFKEIAEIKYIIANTVILEGINLPIDTLFICSLHKLYGKELMNLIGRVNRLNEIFSAESVELKKLLPRIHIINKKDYNEGHNPKFDLLRSRIFDDEIKNPTLHFYDLEQDIKNEKTEEKRNSYRDEVLSIQANEAFLHTTPQNEYDKIKQYYIRSGLNTYYKDLNIAINGFVNAKNSIEREEWGNFRLLDKMYNLFIKDNEDNLSDYEFSRLQNEKARNYYENYILRTLKQVLSQNIKSEYEFLKGQKDKDDFYLFVGNSYGDYSYEANKKEYKKDTNSNKVYVRVSEKSDKQLVNLAVIKIKLEENFISFTLSKFIETMLDFDLITETEYNQYVYGTVDQNKIQLTKTGLSMSLIQRLENDGQLGNLRINNHNNIEPNESFIDFLNNVDDFYRFEINRYLTP